ncbi:phosphatase PAP2 family protein [Candidatus Saccharibacteria bacterium]|nr:phosphatase PAP2 family protein [Candidatus Saccharibacteria bacterium]
MEVLTKLLADGLMVPIGMIAVYALFWRVPKQHRYDRYTYVLMAGVSSYFLAKIIGALWQPTAMRPFEQLGVAAGASSLNNPGFPSDHALFAMFLTLAVWYVSRDNRLAISMFALTLFVCVGRVIALVHTPLDVTGGIVIACVGACWYIIGNRIERNSLAQKAKR